MADGAGNVGAFEATLALAGGLYHVVGLEPGPAWADAQLLGPVTARGQVRFGAYRRQGVVLAGPSVLARLTIEALADMSPAMALTGAQVVDDHGGEYTVTVGGAVVLPRPWPPESTVLLPAVWR